jgi:hypothetical protein
MAQDPVLDSRSAPAGVAFEVDRFEWTATDRLELAGRWTGLRGQRFMRPALTVESADGNRRMLALLDHKPWAPDAESPWIAAFPWEGDPVALDMAELAVAPSIAVQLPPPGAPPGRARGKPDGSTRRAPAKRRAAGERVTGPELAAARTEAADLRERLTQARDGARELGEDLERARDRARHERAAALAAREQAEEALRRVEAERDGARAELAGLRETLAARDDAEAGLRRLEAERDGARAELAGLRESLAGERSELERRLDAAVRQRDHLRGRGSAALAERDAAVQARDVAGAARDAAIAARPDLAPASIASAPRREDALARPDRRRPAPAPWHARFLAVAALAALVIAVATVLHGAL